MELRNSSRGEVEASASPYNGQILKSKNLFKPLTDLNTPIFHLNKESNNEIAFTGIGSIIDKEN
jgi:hypothetical protein